MPVGAIGQLSLKSVLVETWRWSPDWAGRTTTAGNFFPQDILSESLRQTEIMPMVKPVASKFLAQKWETEQFRVHRMRVGHNLHINLLSHI